jgi:hypothetical protein
MAVLFPSLSALDSVCALKQALGRPYSEHNAYDSAKREVDCAGIKQSLKGITHVHSPVFRIGADLAHHRDQGARSPSSSQ